MQPQLPEPRQPELPLLPDGRYDGGGPHGQRPPGGPGARWGRGQQPAASLTLLTTLLDYSDTGVLDVFIDETQVALRETMLARSMPVDMS